MYELIKGDKGSFVFKNKRVKFDKSNINSLTKEQKNYLEKIGLIKKINDGTVKGSPESTGTVKGNKEI